MNETVEVQADHRGGRGVPSFPPLGEGASLKPLAVAIELQSPSGLLAVLTVVARLGCQLTCVHAVGRQASLGVLAPLQVAHRVVPCLGQVIEVLSVVETSDDWI